jgi:CelD/BcsL family acetyltransferase involved in cellulose biosynthesis
VTVRWIAGLEALRVAAPVAEALLERLPPEFCFHDPAWIAAMQGAWGKPGASSAAPRYAFLCAERSGRPIGLAPLELEVKGPLHLGLRRLHWIGATGGPLSVPFPDFMIPDDELRRPCLTAMRDFLLRQREMPWDWLDLQMIPDHSENLAALDAIWPAAVARAEGVEAAIIDPPDPAAPDFTGHLTSKLLADLRRRRRRLEGRGRLAFHEAAALPALVLAQVETIHRMRQGTLRQAGRERESVFDDPAQRGALLGALDRAARDGSGRHAWLELDGRVIAFSLGLQRAGAHFRMMMGFDPAFAADAPSKLLALQALEHEAEHGARRIHFLWGMNRFKADFANRFHGYQFRRYVHPRWIAGARTRWDGWARRLVRRGGGEDSGGEGDGE